MGTLGALPRGYAPSVGGTNSSSRRAIMFVASVIAVFLAPSFIPGLGVSDLSAYTILLLVFAWLALKWGTLRSIQRNSRPWEILVGGALVVFDFAENLLAHSAIGLYDMFIIFVGLWVAFYGLRNARLFILPTLCIGVLIIGYVVDYNVPVMQSLEYFIAGLMGRMMHSLGVQATVYQNQVTLYNPAPVLLVVDATCTGIQGVVAFGLLSCIAVVDLKFTLKKLVPLLAIGFLGAFLVNFLRLALIFSSFQWLGDSIGATMHAYLGYLVFLPWVFIFWGLTYKYLAKGMPPGHAAVKDTTT